VDKRQGKDAGQNDLSLLGLLAVDEEDCRAGDCHDGGQRDEAGARAQSHGVLVLARGDRQVSRGGEKKKKTSGY